MMLLHGFKFMKKIIVIAMCALLAVFAFSACNNSNPEPHEDPPAVINPTGDQGGTENGGGNSENGGGQGTDENTNGENNKSNPVTPIHDGGEFNANN